MDDTGRIKIAAGIDAIVAILLLIVGILVTILGVDYLNQISQAAYPIGMPVMYSVLPWIILMLGITTIIYAVKRLIDDILKVITTKTPYITQQTKQYEQ